MKNFAKDFDNPNTIWIDYTANFRATPAQYFKQLPTREKQSISFNEFQSAMQTATKKNCIYKCHMGHFDASYSIPLADYNKIYNDEIDEQGNFTRHVEKKH